MRKKITEAINFDCKECDFSLTSEKGLKTHIKKKHFKSLDKELTTSFPKQYDCCEKKRENKLETKVHMKTHSYIMAECEEYEYFSETYLQCKFILERNKGQKIQTCPD